MSTTDSPNADPTTQADAIPAPAPRRASEHTADDLKAAVERADAQIADLEQQVEATKAAHREAMHSALLSGQDAPAPTPKQAALDDRLAALRAARADLAEQHRKRRLDEDQRAGAEAAAEVAEIRAEWERRWAMAMAICTAAFDAFAKLTGTQPDVGLVTRDLQVHPDKTTRGEMIAEINAIRRRLPPQVHGYVDGNALSHPHPEPFNKAFRSIAANHIAELIG